MRDRAASNNVAVDFRKVVFPHMVDIRCISHTLNIVSDNIHTPHLSDFMLSWLSLYVAIVQKLKLSGGNRAVAYL